MKQKIIFLLLILMVSAFTAAALQGCANEVFPSAEESNVSEVSEEIISSKSEEILPITEVVPPEITEPPEPSIIVGWPSDWIEGEDFVYIINTEYGLSHYGLRNIELINPEIDLFSYRGDDLNVTIPDYIDDMLVTMMNNHVFPTGRIYESITIGKNIRFINETNFVYCKYLENIFVHEENEYFTSIDGVLYDKDMSKLLVYPLGKTEKEFIVPDGVIWIEVWIFYDHVHLKRVILPDSIESLGWGEIIEESGKRIFVSTYGNKLGEVINESGKMIFVPY
jgi:hypothetical protein